MVFFLDLTLFLIWFKVFLSHHQNELRLPMILLICWILCFISVSPNPFSSRYAPRHLSFSTWLIFTPSLTFETEHRYLLFAHLQFPFLIGIPGTTFSSWIAKQNEQHIVIYWNFHSTIPLLSTSKLSFYVQVTFFLIRRFSFLHFQMKIYTTTATTWYCYYI